MVYGIAENAVRMFAADNWKILEKGFPPSVKVQMGIVEQMWVVMEL